MYKQSSTFKLLNSGVIEPTVAYCNEVIKTISSLFIYLLIFFDKKISCAQKPITSKNQLTKQK